MTDLLDFFKTDLIDDITADLYNNLLASSLHAGLVNVEALTADKTLTDNDFALQVYTPDAARNVSLPAVGAANHPFYIVNASTSFALTVKNAGGSVIQTVGASSAVTFASDGSVWYSLSASEATATAKGTLQLAGQLGGTAASPDVRGLRETAGPTLLTLGAIGDGQGLKRSGASVIGGDFIPADGWVNPIQTWAYASATTITVPAGATAIYSVGDKVKWTQSSTVKYAYVVGVTSTLLTVAGDTVANSAITNNFYSKANSPLGFPQWFAWIPDLTSGSAQLPGYAYARFSIVGRMCTIALNVDNVSIGGVAGSIKVSLPVPSAISSTFWGSLARYLTADGYVPVRGVLTSTYVEVFKSISTTTYAATETGYYLRISGSYEI